MRQIEQKYRREIDIERMWLASRQGEFVFFAILPFSLIVVVVLWDIAPHQLLLTWLIILTGINFLRWVSLRFYDIHKKALLADIGQFKRILFIGCLLAGCWSGLGNFWFLQPAQATSTLIMTLFTLGVGVGAILSWFFYLPGVIAVMCPSSAALIVMAFSQGDKTGIALGLIFLLFNIIGIVASRKLSRMLNHALSLNFENLELRQESEEKSMSLETALKEAEQANAAKTRFLAAASHDLRQPIHALGLFFAELSDRVHSPETAPVIGQVEDAIAAINSMLNALLDVSKLDAGVVKPLIVPTALSELFARLQTECLPIAQETHNELRIRSSTYKVRTDPAMLERMLRNLIGNALRYTENGRVLVLARPRGANIEIQVWDNGIGIPEDQLGEIFVEFHQLQNPARDRRQGLGLGLAIVKRLARLLNHRIKVRSWLGRGSCFSIILPVARTGAASVSAPDATSGNLANAALTGRRILILDDDIAVLAGMRGLLTRWGCSVETAASPAEAEEILADSHENLELLIIDYRLPGAVSGIELAKIWQSRFGDGFPVLVITGDTGPERLREAEASGYPLLHKPVQPARLRSTLQYLFTK